MNTLVTGGAGFIGCNLVRRLSDEGHAVRVLDDLSTGRTSNLVGVDADFIEGSVTDQGLLRAAMKGADVVFHQAALPSVPRSVEHPLLSNEVNVVGTLSALVASREEGVKRFVYAASSSAYGNTPTLPKHEAMTPHPLSPYAVAKYAGERYCAAFSATYSLSTVSLRYFNVFGPFQDPTSGYAAVVPAFATALLSDESPTIHGDGEQTRDFTYVENVVDANLLAARADDRVSGRVVNIGCGDRITISTLFALIQDATSATVGPSHGPARRGDVRDSLADISLARELLGYEPAIGHREGIERTVDWYRAQQQSAELGSV